EGTRRDRGGAPRGQEITSSRAVADHTTAGSANALGFRQGIARHFRGAEIMKATQLLHNLGQSIWLDNITRDLLTSDTLADHYRRSAKYISERSSRKILSAASGWRSRRWDSSSVIRRTV